jgi:Flp pilus assembly protein TadD
MFLLVGILSGFLLGYLTHEQMSARQPALKAPGVQVAAAAPPPAPSAANPSQGMEQVQRLRAYVEQNPTDSRAVRELANMNYDIGNWQRATELYRQFLGLVPDDPDAMTDLGACLRNMGQASEALAVFQRIKAVAPQHWQARFNEVLVLGFDLGRWDAADLAVKELQALQPTNPDVIRLADEVKRKTAGA